MEKIGSPKYVTATKTIANLAAAGTYTVDISLDDTYDICDGIAFADDGAGLGSAYTIGIQNQLRSVMDATPADIIVVGKEDGCPPDQKFLTHGFGVKGGNKVTVTIVTAAACSADTKVTATFRMWRTKYPVSI